MGNEPETSTPEACESGEQFEMSQPTKTKRRSRRRKSLRGRLGSGSWLGLLHPRSGEPCSFEEWKRAEIARIMEKDE